MFVIVWIVTLPKLDTIDLNGCCTKKMLVCDSLGCRTKLGMCSV